MTRHTIPLIALPMALLVGCDGGATLAPAGELAASRTTVSAAAANPNGLYRSVWPSPEDPGAPFYARITPVPPIVFMAGGWAVIPFYRDPGCLTANRPTFNLIGLFDPPAAFACALTVSGFSLWHGAVGNGSPHTVVSTGNGAVPIWFVPEAQMTAALADGELTITELAALPGLLVGYATHFNELLQPHPVPFLGGGGHPVPKLVLNARGELEDGRKFTVHITGVADQVQSISIRF